MTLPLIQGLMNQMDEFPPVALIAAGLVQANKPKPVSQSLAGIGVPIKKKRKGDSWLPKPVK